MPLHLCFITHEYPDGNSPGRGGAHYVQRVSRLLVKRGHRVSVVVMGQNRRVWNDGDIYVRELIWPENLLSRWPGGSRSITFSKRTFLRGTYPALIRMWAAKQVEHAVWHIHEQNPLDLIQATNCLALGFALRKNRRIPLITRVANYQPLLRSAGGRQRSFSTTLCDWLEVKQVLDSDASFAPSAFLATAYEKLEGHRLTVIPSPMEPLDLYIDDSFYKANLDEKKYLLFAGEISRLKGADLVIDLLPGILQAYPDLTVVFIGEQTKISGRNAFDVVADRTAAFAHRVFCFPPIPKKFLFPVIQHAVAVLIPSRADNYPNACLEAQALGKIVIGTRDSSLDEMVGDGITGFLAENGSSQSLREAIERVLNMSEEQRLEMEAVVLANVQRIYQEDRIGNLEKFYYDVISNFRTHQVRG